MVREVDQLAQAILASSHERQSFTHIQVGSGKHRQLCALGMAFLTTFGNEPQVRRNPYSDLRRYYAVLDRAVKHCPISTCTGSYSLLQLLIHLNDDHHWHPTTISSFLRSLDDTQPFLQPYIKEVMYG